MRRSFFALADVSPRLPRTTSHSWYAASAFFSSLVRADSFDSFPSSIETVSGMVSASWLAPSRTSTSLLARHQ
jgi:hypothetical protein